MSIEKRTAILSDAEQKAWREDLRYLYDKLQQQHPNPFYRYPQSAFERHVSDIEAQIPYFTRNQIITALVKLMARIDGHSGIPPAQEAIGFHLYPMQLYMFSDGLYVVTGDDSVVGMRVLRIGRFDALDVWKLLSEYVPYDNKMSVKSITPIRIVTPEILEALNIIEDDYKPVYILQTAQGEQLVFNPSPALLEDYRKLVGSNNIQLLPARSDALYMSRRKEFFWFTFQEDNKLLYIQYNVVYSANEAGETIADFAKQIETCVNENPVEKVVIDLRHNGGGDNTTYEPMVSLLSQNPTINQHGRLFAITSRQTFSAAGNFVTELKNRSQALIVGEAMGGGLNQYGDAEPVTLPNSGIVAYISTLYHQKSTPEETRVTIEPDIHAELSSHDYFEGRDPALDAILNYA